MRLRRIALVLVAGCTTPRPIDAGIDAWRPDEDVAIFDAGRDAGDPPMPDGGVPDDAMPDAPMPVDAGPMVPTARVDRDGDGVSDAAAALGCMGVRTAPTGGAPASFRMRLLDLETGVPLPKRAVEVHRDNVVADSCLRPFCERNRTDTRGEEVWTLPSGGWFAYRALATATYLESRGFNFVASSTSTTPIDLYAVSEVGLDRVLDAIGRDRAGGAAFLLGLVVDCEDRPIENAHVRAYIRGTELVPGPRPLDFTVTYLSGGSPAPERTMTGVTGAYAAVNIPVTDTSVQLEAWASLAPGGPLQRIACEVLGMSRDSVLLIPLGPLRADYGDGHPCTR